jgi:hypothetical protein
VYIKVTWKKVFDYVNFEKDADQGRWYFYRLVCYVTTTSFFLFWFFFFFKEKKKILSTPWENWNWWIFIANRDPLLLCAFPFLLFDITINKTKKKKTLSYRKKEKEEVSTRPVQVTPSWATTYPR